jgi:malate dehydrogenase (oxaloacetate-decarboxylating)(NADP+)
VDTHLLVEPTAAQIAEMTLLAAEQVRSFGLTPKVALLSHSSFGASGAPSARKMRAALKLIHAQAPELEVDGEMHADAALVPLIRARAVPDSPLEGTANLLVFPNLDAANIAFNLMKAVADGLQVGPMLLGMNKPIHVLTPSVTARGIANLAAVAGSQVARG